MGPRRYVEHAIQHAGKKAHRGEPLLLIVDLTDERLGGAALVESLARGRRQGGPSRTLGFYSDIDAAARERAGLDLGVPRSRMAREGAELVSRLLGEPSARRCSG